MSEDLDAVDFHYFIEAFELRWTHFGVGLCEFGHNAWAFASRSFVQVCLGSYRAEGAVSERGGGALLSLESTHARLHSRLPRWEMCGDVWGKGHQIRSCAVASEIFAPDPTFQFGEVVFRAHSIAA